jgi:uncharacterized membrane protein YhhN
MNGTQFFLVFFTIISIIHIITIVLKNEKLRRISKCLIVPPLLGAYIAGTGNWLLFPVPALVLGWIGDVLLIKIQKKGHFITGLASFLLGHLFYIITFVCILGFFGFGGAAGNINIPAVIIFTPPSIVLGMVVFRLIKPTKEMYGPVIVYMIVLITMSLFGFQVFLLNPGVAGLLILSGSFNFMVSDTILAYYTFRKLKLSGAVLIMVYYILAQAEIILGLLLLKQTALF